MGVRWFGRYVSTGFFSGFVRMEADDLSSIRMRRLRGRRRCDRCHGRFELGVDWNHEKSEWSAWEWFCSVYARFVALLGSWKNENGA